MAQIARRNRKVGGGFDWSGWFKGNLLAILGIVAAVVGFGYTQIKTIDAIKNVVERHEQQFGSMQKTFEKFDNTQKSNYEDYAKNAKIEAEKTSKALETMSTALGDLKIGQARSDTESKGVSKQLDEVKTELRGITTRQQENRQIFQGRR